MAAIPQFPIQGPSAIFGSHLNKLVTALNNITGNGSAQAVTGTTGIFTGLLTASGGQKTSGSKTVGITTVAAAGTSVGTATAIVGTASVVLVTTTASSEGVKLPTPATGLRIDLYAPTAHGVKVYARASGQSIGTATTNTTAYAVAANKGTFFLAISATKWMVNA